MIKPYKILIFILLTFSLLGLLGFVFPKEGVEIGTIVLSFPSPESVFTTEEDQTIDIEQTLATLKQQTDISRMRSLADSLLFYREFISQNTARFYFPNDNYLFFDKLFARLEKAKTASRSLHILHYGDSQIEMDRISSIFRQYLQEKFEGEGAGVVPPIQTIPTFTVRQSYSGALSRYVVYGDTSQPRASHRRYGLLANFAQLNGSASITVGSSNYRQAQEKTKQFSRLALIIGNNAAGFSVACQSKEYAVKEAQKGVKVMTWDFNTPVSQVSLRMTGKAEIYGVSLEGKSGITVDNIPLRGCSGTIFTRIDSLVLKQCYEQMNVCMIILQFGGNMMPQINSQKAIDRYMESITRQINYLQRLNPSAPVLFIGPSDMSKRVNGKMQTYPYLSELNDALKATVLKNNAAYWDMFHVMGGENAMLAWVKHVPAWAGSDYIHFTEAGANQIATTLSDAFMVYYQFYALRKMANPELIERFLRQNQK
ncbi:MAG: GDSL-type esterase/lipase family protein [Bacteroidales bacterium]|jgi:lysophospholipase L1-like esterase|nr:GDSL-type esterase/lipase family protein [Bacteroidales bacterium]